MHIAYFTNYYLPVINGVVRSVELFRNELTKLGHNVFIFAQEDENINDKVPFIFRYPSLSLPMQIDVPTVIPVSPFVDQLLPSLMLDIIHTHHPVLLGQAAASKAKELNLPLVFTFHTQYREYTHYVPLPQEAIQDFLKETVDTWLRDFMRKCQHVIIPSKSMEEILIREYGLQNHYTVIPTGMDLTAYRQADGKAFRSSKGWQDEIVLISTGRLALEKNWETLLHAAAKVHENHPDLRIVLIGDGPDKEKLQDLAAELGISERVTFTGEIPFSDVATHLKAADIFGFASITETQGLATMEAIAAGLPVVAVDASGTRDIVDDSKQGFLVPNDADALAASINQLIESPKIMRKFRKNAQKKAKDFDAENQTKKLVKVYEQAIQDKKDEQYVSVEES